MESAKVTAKGQVTIPKSIKEFLEIKEVKFFLFKKVIIL